MIRGRANSLPKQGNFYLDYTFSGSNFTPAFHPRAVKNI